MYYYPGSKTMLRPWALNLKTQIGSIGIRINEPAADIAKVETNMDKLVADIDNWENARKEVQRLGAIVNETAKQLGKETREYIARLKTNPLLTEADEHTLQIVSTTSITDLTDYQPKLSGKNTGGNVHLSFQKRGADGMNVYGRLHGETAWKLLGNAKQSPFEDTRLLADASVPEFREYYIMPTLANTEVGQRSEVLSIKYTG